ncbi:MAG: hypothetical protein IKZ28_04145, partial [Clostridia bacterium]|nr:hypothetical protein [Clostridia bacterium]
MKIKKMTALLAGISFIGVSLLSSVGCKDGGIFGNNLGESNVKGTEGAKIALARERLDESVFEKKLSFWEEEETKKTSADEKGEIMPLSAMGLGNIARGRTISLASNSASMQDGVVRWTEFSSEALTLTNFKNVFSDIERRAGEVAKSIGEIKKYVGATEKWVNGNQLLRVDESAETLMEKYHFESASDFGYQVANRYTREDAKNIYDTHSYWENASEIGNVRMKYIPNEYYESSYIHSSGFNDMFVAQKNNGLWNFARFGYFEERGGYSFNIENYVIVDGVGIGVWYGEREMDGERRANTSYTFFDMETGAELFRLTENDGSYVVTTYLGNVKSGLAGVEADMDDVREDDGVYFNAVGLAGKLAFSNGKTSDDVQYDGVQFQGVDVGYDYMTEKYSAMASMAVEADGVWDALQEVEGYYSSNGVTMKMQISDYADEVAYAKDIAKNFPETFEWDGCKAATIEGMQEGVAKLKAFFSENAEKYASAKDLGSVEFSKTKAVSVENFATVEMLDASQSSYADGKITLNNASLKIGNSEFLEAGKEYVFKLGLALRAENGLESVNTIPLETENEQKVLYTEGEGLTVTQSGEYLLPTNLSEGDYAIVGYLATADEGIRISELKEITFGEATGGNLSSSAMKIEVKSENGVLTALY